MARLGARLGASAALGLSIATGCASGDAPTFSEFGWTDDANRNADLAGANGLGPTVTHGDDEVGNVTPGSACASSSAGATIPPISLVFMVDKSGSMGGDNLEAKWNAAVDTMKAFFADPAASSIRASLAFFPAVANECSASTYAAPAVPMRALPDAASFAAALDANAPGGETPTLPAMTGAVQYAQSIAATVKPNEKVAIVLVTDGDPNVCASTPENVAGIAESVVTTIKTYVVGVGNLATKLDTIASGGGTAPHIQVNTTSAAETASDLRAAISRIKAAQLGCSYPLPAPAHGETLDVNAVNVDYTPAGRKPQTLPYSAQCKNPNGWHYDDPTAPKQIVMCPDACTTLHDDTSGGKVDIIFGCVTVGGIPR